MTSRPDHEASAIRALERHAAALGLPGLEPPLTVRPLLGGRSNLTYLVVDRAGERTVLRRPPESLVAPSANDLAREHRVLKALERAAVPTPRAMAFCEDVSLIGAPFLLMSYIDGETIDGVSGAALDRASAQGATASLVDVLATVHETDLDRAGLTDFARHGGYLHRQVRRWQQQWEHVRHRELPSVHELQARLQRSLPDRDSATALVHGDFRFDNTLHAKGDPSKVVGVLDWEMSTLGDPLADLGVLLAYWDECTAPLLPHGNPAAVNPAFPGADDVAQLYHARTGAPLDKLAFYRALAYFKLAVIAEGLYHRHLLGNARGEGFDAIGAAVPAIVDRGLELLPG